MLRADDGGAGSAAGVGATAGADISARSGDSAAAALGGLASQGAPGAHLRGRRVERKCALGAALGFDTVAASFGVSPALGTSEAGGRGFSMVARGAGAAAGVGVGAKPGIASG